jgi:subtilisin-like proprotein convertase family protein
MDARKQLLCVVTIFAVVVRCSSNAYAGPVTYSGNFNLRIPANPADTKGWMNDAVLEITQHYTIHDIDVGITLTHTSDFDLQILLKSPAGKTICLNKYDFDQFFKGADYTNTIFDDEALPAIEDAQPPFTGRFRPIELLSAFDGGDSFGFWKLRIYDAWAWDTGTLNKFELVITNPEPATAALLAVGFGLMIRLNNSKKR